MAITLGTASAASLAQDADPEALPDDLRWELPTPDEYASQLQALCKPETESALFIAALRDRGLSKAQVLERLPEGNSDRLRLVRVVVENLDDLFTYRKIRPATYFIFRSQSCVREKAEGKPAVLFGEIAERAHKCQDSAGTDAAQRLAECVRGLMP
jgi:hypothetical protein